VEIRFNYSLIHNTMFKNKGQIVEIVNRAVPYSGQVRNWQLDRDDDSIEFDWRGTTYWVNIDGSVREMEGNLEKSSSESTLMEALLGAVFTLSCKEDS
jgi:hypothetical protein